ncbi:hypothetical protein [Rhodococcus phage RGL3]|uniref:Uncharacterized protein n=1 Tax=Rhodococcus phage RGL3 TaxID=2922221 RepID=G9FHN8_9CAUD|nr:hypothetical protein RoPhRGL3_gp46 [Rhodococcus phage RGL3]AEV52126.1 hypothetical protein [Rhodococcus phage RGL3]
MTAILTRDEIQAMTKEEFLMYANAKVQAGEDLTLEEDMRLTMTTAAQLTREHEKLKVLVESLKDVSESFAEVLSVKAPELLAEVQVEYGRRQEKRFMEAIFGPEFVAGLDDYKA